MKEDIGLSEELRLIEALQSRQAKAYSIFYNHYAAALNGVIGGFVKDKRIRNKILSEVLYDIWEDIPNYKFANQRLFTWMIKKTRLRTANAVLKHKINIEQKSNEINSPVVNMKHVMYDSAQASQSNGLTQEELEIFNLVYYKGMSNQKVAESKNFKISKVRRIVRKAITSVRDSYKV